MKHVLGFVGGALVFGALTFGGSASVASGAFAAGAPWSAESLQKDATASNGASSEAVDLTAVTSYNLGW